MKKFILSLVAVFVMGVALSTGVNVFAGAEVLSPATGGFYATILGTIGGFASWVLGIQPMNAAFGALQKEVWIADIMENLFNNSEFISMSIDDSSLVSNKTVNLPQAGAKPTVVKNRSSFPGSITERTDAILTYDIDNFTTDPVLVRNFDEVQISYDKRQSVMSEHQAILTERIGDEILVKWSPSASAVRVLRTTGDTTSELPTSATGTRKKITKEDIAAMAKQLDKDNAPKDGRVLLLNPTMYYELFGIDALINIQYMNGKALPDGVVNRIFGFDVYVRNNVTMFNSASAGVIKAVGAAAAATDCFGALAWSKYRVRRAVGSVDVYYNPDRAEYYGGILSAELNFGGSKARTNGEGIVAIAQGVGA